MLRTAARGLAAGLRAPITRPSWFASMAAQEWISGSDVNDGPVPPAMKTACPGPEVTSPFPVPCRGHSVAAFLCAPSLSRTRPVSRTRFRIRRPRRPVSSVVPVFRHPIRETRLLCPPTL